MIGGSMYWKSDRQKRKEFDSVVLERKAREKNDAWIRELEARDEEDKQIKAEKEKRRAAKQGVAKSMVDDSERRRGTLEMVTELVYGRK
jgi:hypothetical protein